MKTRFDKFFNIFKWMPIVAFGVAAVLNIISGDYDAAILKCAL